MQSGFDPGGIEEHGDLKDRMRGAMWLCCNVWCLERKHHEALRFTRLDTLDYELDLFVTFLCYTQTVEFD